MDAFKKLINEVKKHPLLYDKNHEDYNDIGKKHLAWENAGVAINMTGERARKKWENIHCAYISSLSSGGNANKFSNLLSFLEVEGDKTFRIVVNTGHEYSWSIQWLHPRSSSPSMGSSINESTCTMSIAEYPIESSFVERTSTPKSKKRKRELNKSDVVEEKIANEVNVCDSPPVSIGTTSLVGLDDVDSFCQLIALRMKTFSDYQIKEIKRQILEIVHKTEIENLSL